MKSYSATTPSSKKPSESSPTQKQNNSTQNNSSSSNSFSQSGKSSSNSSSQSSSNSSNSSSRSQGQNQSVPQTTKTPDYNLNDRYVAGYVTWTLFKSDDSNFCYEAGKKTFFGIGKFNGKTDALDVLIMPQYFAYVNANGYDSQCGGFGATPMTWEEAIAKGIALDEAKCTQYGLSCGRW